MPFTPFQLGPAFVLTTRKPKEEEVISSDDLNA